MSRCYLPRALAAALVLGAGSAAATPGAFTYARESRVATAGETALEPSTTFRVGRERYYSALDGRFELEHGLTQALQLSLSWSFGSYGHDVVRDLGRIERVTGSEFAGASCALQYRLSDAAADALGSALYVETTLGPRRAALAGELIADRALGRWLFAANLGVEYGLEPTRTEAGTELETALVLEPALAAAYAIAQNVSLGLELHAPLGLSGDPKSAPLFGGPVLSWADGRFWGALGVQAQLLALSGASADNHLALARHERVQVRLLVGVAL